MVALNTSQLIEQWEEYRRNLGNEVTRATQILNILQNLVPGVSIVGPPLIDFQTLANGGTKVTIQKASPDQKRPPNVEKSEITTILQNANPYAPLLTITDLARLIAQKRNIQLDTKIRNEISQAAKKLADNGLVGRLFDQDYGRHLYGDLQYFDGGNTLKPKYRNLLETIGEETPQLYSPPPTPTAPKGKIELSKEEFDQWRWVPEIVKWLDSYDPTKDGLTSVTQIVDIFAAKYKHVTADQKKTIPLVNAHISNLYNAKKIGRVKVKTNSKQKGGRQVVFLYGHPKYFDMKGDGNLLPEYDYLAVYMDTPAK